MKSFPLVYKTEKPLQLQKKQKNYEIESKCVCVYVRSVFVVNASIKIEMQTNNSNE